MTASFSGHKGDTFDSSILKKQVILQINTGRFQEEWNQSIGLYLWEAQTQVFFYLDDASRNLE